MPDALDHIFIFFFAIYGPVYTQRVWYPRFLRDAAAGVPNLRNAAYRRILLAQFFLMGVGLLLWAYHWREFAALGLGEPNWGRFLAAVQVIIFVAIGQAWQGKRILSNPDKRGRSLARLGRIEPFLPHTREELRRFCAVGVAAGVGEEILYRGYLLWYLRQFGNLEVAVLVSAIVFGLAHSYQGRMGVLRTGLIGLVLALLYVLTDALYASMFLHALINLIGGWLAFELVRSQAGAAAANAAPAAPAS